MKKIYLVRHGESIGNLEGVFKDPQAELTERGHQQAQDLARHSTALGIQKIVSSPNRRALQTAEYISAATGFAVEQQAYFCATKYAAKMVGVSKTGPEAEEYMKLLKEMYARDPNERFEDAENFNDLKTRFSEGLVYLKQLPEEVVLVVTHNSIIQSLIVHVLLEGQQTIEQHVSTKKTIGNLGHQAVTTFIYDGIRWQVGAFNETT